MRPTMLDALLDEAHNIREAGLAIEVAIVAREQRFEQLIRQIAKLRDEGRDAPASISATATAQEFQEFQISYFPFSVLQRPGSLGDLPEAQDSEQGNHGSGEVAPGEAVGPQHAEPEQAVAEAASEERIAARADPEAALEPSIKDRFLDLYASTDRTIVSLAAEVGCSDSAGRNYLTAARRYADNRAAKGDLLRDDPGKGPVESRARPRPTDPKPLEDVAVEDHAVSFADPPAGQELIEINQRDSTATYRDRRIVITKVERRILMVLNRQLPCDMEAMMQAASVMTGSSLTRELTKLNARIGVIDLEVFKDAAAMFTLRRKLAEF